MMLRILAEMPFAKHTGSVARIFQRLSDGDFVQGEFYHIVHWPKRTAAPIETIDVADRINSCARHILPAHQRGTGRLAVWSAGLAAGEANALFRQTIDIGGLVILASVRTEVCVAQIVCENEDDV